MLAPRMASLLDQLPKTRGELQTNAPLKNTTWFKVGGNAEVLFQPADENDLAEFLKQLPARIPVTVLGLASNTIVRDGGIDGVVIRLGQAFKQVSVANNVLTAGAAVVDAIAARTALTHSLTGIEFMSGIPGSIGGGVRMNAGAYGREFKDALVDVRVVTRQGEIKTFTNAECGFSYRHSSLPEDAIFVSARFQLQPGDPSTIKAQMENIQTKRGETQPIKSYTGGSTFANPEGHKAWQLIDAAGCRGFQIGGAQVSAQHCNFLINTGNATAADIENLGEDVRAKVKAKSGIELRWEIKRIGKKL